MSNSGIKITIVGTIAILAGFTGGMYFERNRMPENFENLITQQATIADAEFCRKAFRSESEHTRMELRSIRAISYGFYETGCSVEFSDPEFPMHQTLYFLADQKNDRLRTARLAPNIDPFSLFDSAKNWVPSQDGKLEPQNTRTE